MCEQMPSTMAKLRETSLHLPPKLAVTKLCQEAGAVAGGSSAAQLPRSQVYLGCFWQSDAASGWACRHRRQH